MASIVTVVGFNKTTKHVIQARLLFAFNCMPSKKTQLQLQICRFLFQFLHFTVRLEWLVNLRRRLPEHYKFIRTSSKLKWKKDIYSTNFFMFIRKKNFSCFSRNQHKTLKKFFFLSLCFLRFIYVCVVTNL